MRYQHNLLMKCSWIILSGMIFLSCKDNKNNPSNNSPKTVSSSSKKDLIDADIKFSEACKSSGMKNSYINFLDNDGVLIRNDNKPIEGANAIEYLSQLNDRDVIFSRQPMHAFISESGEMGLTYGIYSIKSTIVDSVVYYGSYTSAWKKQLDGSWKILLDAKTEGFNE